MATPLTSFSVERITSERKKDKASIQVFFYTLNRKSHDVEYWVCEKRGICKARLHTHNNQVVKPTDPSKIQSEHSHGSDISRVDMLETIQTFNLREMAEVQINFVEQIKETRKSIQDSFKKSHEALRVRESNLLSRVDEIEKEYNSKTEEMKGLLYKPQRNCSKF